MTRHSTPASDLGNLALGSSSSGDMPVQTRAMSRTTRQGRNLAASQQASSRATAGPSRQPPARPQRGSRPTQQAAQSGDGSDDDDDDDSDDDGDGGDGDESSSEEEDEDESVQDVVNQIMTVLDPTAWYTPTEFGRLNGTAPAPSVYTRNLATAMAQLIRNNNDLTRLRTAGQLGRGYWAEKLHLNMNRRYDSIRGELNRNVVDSAQGVGVPGTIDALRALFNAVDRDIRLRYFGRMEPATQQRFAHLLVQALRWMCQNHDLYAGQARATFAGEGYQSESRLFAAFMAEAGRALEFLGVMGRFPGASLRPQAQLVRDLSNFATGVIRAMLADNPGNPDRVRLGNIVRAFSALAHHAAHG